LKIKIKYRIIREQEEIKQILAKKRLKILRLNLRTLREEKKIQKKLYLEISLKNKMS
jgi:ribosomal protein L19E